MVRRAIASQLNSRSARPRPALPWRSSAARSGRWDERVHRLGQRRLEPLRVRRCVRHQQPGRAVGDDLGDAADADATTAVSQAIASRLTIPSGSYTEGQTNRVAWVSSWTTSGRGSISEIHTTPVRVSCRDSTAAAVAAPSPGCPARRRRAPAAPRGQSRGRRRTGARRPSVGDPADEDHVRPVRVDAVALQHVGVAIRRVQPRVDAVVHHVHLVRVHERVDRQDVPLHPLADGDHRVAVAVRGALGPGRHPVAPGRAARSSTVAAAPASAR